MIRILESKQVGRLFARRAARLGAAEAIVRPIIEDVRKRGDKALLEYARKFDGLKGRSVRVPPGNWPLTPEFRKAVETASANIRAVAEIQAPQPQMRQIKPGLQVGQIVRPL